MPWHHIADPQSPELDELASRYQIHPLHVEDCRDRKQRTKLEETPRYLFVILKTMKILDDDELDIKQLSIFIGHDFCVTVGDTATDPAAKILDSARRLAHEDRADEVFYRLFDGVVDSYLPLIDCIDDRIDGLEDAVLDNPSPENLQQIFRLKRILIEMRRVLVNTRDVSIHLMRESCPFIDNSLAPFFRDIFDHVARNLDSAETHRDLLSGTLDVYLSSLANRTNNVMKVLTILSTIALPALVISGIYGMNIKGIPYLDNPHSVWIVFGLMGGTTVALLYLLRRFGWL